jgi:hypothetical protein
VTASDTAEAAPPEDAAAEAAVEAVAESVPRTAEPSVVEAAADEEEEEEDRGDPLFEVSDRRATILADRVGIVFRLDGEEADFTWDEIGAVEIDTPRFGKRFAVTVYTGPRRWFEAHVEAKSRGLLKTWTAELDAVLDEHFEDPEEKAAAEPPEPAPDAKDEAEATGTPDAKSDTGEDAGKATDEDAEEGAGKASDEDAEEDAGKATDEDAEEGAGKATAEDRTASEA